VTGSAPAWSARDRGEDRAVDRAVDRIRGARAATGVGPARVGAVRSRRGAMCAGPFAGDGAPFPR